MTVFERYPKTTLATLVLMALLSMVGLFEWAAYRWMGLGDPVVYQSHPIFGYRPIPNQHLHRFQGKSLDFNNLGLRADQDWDDNPKGKMLFVGDSVTYGGSYISNAELFSTLVGQQISKKVGNAGVNAWGVENVYALLVQDGFLPADYYVSTFPEGDFLRGLNRLGGQPFWPRKPRCALEELYQYYLYKLTNFKYNRPSMPLSKEEEKKVIVQAVQHLKEMDAFLRAKGFQHQIFITPTKQQALGLEPKDLILLEAFKEADLHPVYLLDSLDKQAVGARHDSPEAVGARHDSPEIESWYTDNIHLSVQGHQQWAVWIAHVLSFE